MSDASAPRSDRSSVLTQPRFLPMNRDEMQRLGWDALDVLLVSGDAYVDHPSFGVPLLGRWLVRHGWRVGIVAQPRWDRPDDLTRMGRPRLYAGVSAGSLDSMLAHYTAFRKKRHDDAYTPGGQAGSRPNRASIVYANLLRQAFPGLPVILGGIEASLRRTSHYDFWSDAVRRPLVLDSKATAIAYGMGERAVLALAGLFDGLDPDMVRDPRRLRPLLARIPGLAFAGSPEDLPPETPVLELPSHEDILADPQALIRATALLEQQVHQDKAAAVQSAGGRQVILTRPGSCLESDELDLLASLPYTRLPHPCYTQRIPAADMIRTSVTTHRGCAGGCSFCTLALHQGRRIRSRSKESVLQEVRRIAKTPGWTGSISDVGGPSANMWGAHCAADPSSCVRASCLTPRICPFFKVRQADFVELLRAVSRLDSVKHVRVASGWRIDLALSEMPALSGLIREFVGGQAKVAPEHCVDSVLELMRKPTFDAFEAFLRLFAEQSRKAGKEQYVIPYLMSAFPGCTDADMRTLSGWLKAKGWKPNQVQCFIPLPGTAAAAMYYAETDLQGRPIYVAKTDAARLRQHAILIPTVGRKPGSSKKKPAGAHKKTDEPRWRKSAPDGSLKRGRKPKRAKHS